MYLATWDIRTRRSKGFKAGVDYDFFPFPVLDNKIPQVVFGSVDTWVYLSPQQKTLRAPKSWPYRCLDRNHQQLWLQTEGASCSPLTVCQPAAYFPTSTAKNDFNALEKCHFTAVYDLSTPAPVAEKWAEFVRSLYGDNILFQNYLDQTETIARANLW